MFEYTVANGGLKIGLKATNSPIFTCEEIFFYFCAGGGGGTVEKLDVQSSILDLKPQIGQFGLLYFSTGEREENSRKSGRRGLQM